MDIQKLVYDSHNGDSKMNCRTGQEVQIIRELTEKEADIEDVGRMFRVRFPDGYVTDVFADELVLPKAKHEVIIKTSEGDMTVEEFLHWELRGGQGTYEADLAPNARTWDELPLDDKIAYMANSIIGDVLDAGITFAIVKEEQA